MRAIAVMVTLLLLLGGCGNGAGDPFGIEPDQPLQAALQQVREDGDAVRLADLTDIAWDTVHIFSEGASADDVRDAVGTPVLNDDFFFTAGNLLVFTLDGQPQRASILVPAMLSTGGRVSWPDSVQVQADPPGAPLTLSED